MNKIGKFEIVEMLGRGAMGVVYKGYDSSLNRHVAIKVMTSHLEMDSSLRARFFREAQAAGSLQHPNIITVFELGDSAGKPYIAMEYVPGRDLDEIIEAREPLTVVEKVDLIEQVCRGLSYAHERGIIHRDIKPANIRVTEMGQVKLMDFGIAHLVSSELTQTGSLMGTPYYMAPEVVEGKNVDERSDIFSVGATFYELLAYTRPFQGESLQTVFHKILSSQPAPLRDLGFDISPLLQNVLDTAMAKHPEERYGSVSGLLSDLMKFWETIPASAQARAAASTALGETAKKAAGEAKKRQRRRRRLTAAAVAALLLVGGGATLWGVLGPPGSGNAEADEAQQVAASNGPPAEEQPRLRPTEEHVEDRVEERSPVPIRTPAEEETGAAAEGARTAEPERRAEPEARPNRRAAAANRERVARARRDYEAAEGEVSRARSDARAVQAATLAPATFGEAEDAREQGLQAAAEDRYEEAARRMRAARGDYVAARVAAVQVWEDRLDSARTRLATLRARADTGRPGYREAGEFVAEADRAEAAGDYGAALDRLAQAAAEYRRAERPKPAAGEAAEEPAEPMPEEIVQRTLEQLQNALEREDIAAVRRIWTNLSSTQLSGFEAWFKGIRDLQVSYDVRSVNRVGDAIHVEVNTTYRFFDENKGSRDQQEFVQELELGPRGDRWVVVRSRD